MISIIVPVYNVEDYLNKCVESIVNQTYKDIEIILVDDGSPDNCPSICDLYAKTDSRIKVIHKQNGGLMSARQAGLRASTGEYVGFVDGDDWIEPDMYECFANAIEQYKPDIVLSEFYFSYPDREEKSEQIPVNSYYSKSKMEEELYPTMLFNGTYYRFGIYPCCWSKVYKKELLEKHLLSVPLEIRMGEDAAFTYPCLLDADNLAYVDKPLYHYRDNPSSMSNAYDKTLEDIIMIPIDILRNTFEKNYPQFLSQLDYYIVYMMNFVVRNESKRNNNKSAKEKIKTLKRFAQDERIITAAKSIDYSLFPIHIKLVAEFFSVKSAKLLYLYSELLKIFLTR